MKILIFIFSFIHWASISANPLHCMNNREVVQFYSEFPSDEENGFFIARKTTNAGERELFSLNTQCKKRSYGEYFDSPISLISFTDKGDLIGSFWISGTAYILRIHDVNSGKLILEVYSKTPPSIFWDRSYANPIVHIEKDNRLTYFGWFIFDDNNQVYRQATKKESMNLARQVFKKFQ
ncbi:hypothetical protein [Diaphorobacter aerolatus]|uniref:Uncharacterized protein n=1 Tax=Diaphorobacter aerolatus TaxID=1288495 RepID=A0A7H0GM44_9BURK|nr:hypothetical protein [Diaphorobacter aerolatus]QNP49360.1 hypothetical protein H9K75_04720 [Diaphorobacter aerolatus]